MEVGKSIVRVDASQAEQSIPMIYVMRVPMWQRFCILQ